MKGWRQFLKHDARRTTDLRRNRRMLRFLREIKTWQLALILLIFLLLALVFLRLNYIGMIELVTDLKNADRTGDIAQVESAALRLQNYVTKHMNAAPDRVALQTLYEQAAQAAIDAARPQEVDPELYQRTTAECAPQRYSGGTRAWAQCIADRIGTTLVEEEKVIAVSPYAYYVNFASPILSFDAAGITVLICYLLAFIIVLRLVMIAILHAILRLKYRAV